MIDEEATFKKYGYTSDELKLKSAKRVVAICDECGQRRDLKFQDYRELCIRCSHRHVSDYTRKKISEAMSGENHPWYGKHHTEESKKKISESKSGENHPLYGKCHSEETKKKMSATKQGIAYEEWEAFSLDHLYCPKFDENCRESNRDKYNSKCFICGLPESENTDSNGKPRKLSVHHIDMDKLQGCDGVRWKLVPVCMHCHPILHTELWESRIEYLLGNLLMRL